MTNSYSLGVIKIRYKLIGQPSRKTGQKTYDAIKVTIRSVIQTLDRQNVLKFSNNKYQQNKKYWWLIYYW